MAEKNINARVQHKHDVEANWLKASSFVPKQGEIVVYDVDSTHTYERIKIGDGTTVVGSLPFVNDEIRQALTSGATKVSKAETADRATTADSATSAQTAQTAVSAQTANSATVADTALVANSATKATQDGNGKVIADTYETKENVESKIEEALLNSQADLSQTDDTAPDYVRGMIRRESLPDGYPYSGMTELFSVTDGAVTDDGYPVTQPLGLVAGDTYEVNWNGTLYSCVAEGVDMDGLVFAGLGDTAILGGGEPTGKYPFVMIEMPEGMAEGGIYAAVMPLDGSETVTFSVFGGGNIPIDKKWLPEGYPYIVEAGVTVVQEKQYIPEDGAILLPPFNKSVTYKVTWNGTEYTVAPIVLPNNGFGVDVCWGNPEIFGLEGTEEPFVIMIYQGSTVAMVQDESTAVTLKIVTERSYVAMDGRYMPGGGGMNLLNGSASGSLIGTRAAPESDSYSIGSSAMAIGYQSKAPGDNALAFGSQAVAEGDYSFAFGDGAKTTNVGAFALGTGTEASGLYAFAEGESNIAAGRSSHAEGAYSTASGNASHAEGSVTTASAKYSHAEGFKTIAASENQHVQGRYNIEDADGEYAHIVGNGHYYSANKETVRSNAHTLDWDGNAWFAGNIYVGGTSQDDLNAKEVALKTEATTSTAGLMSAADKSKLDGIATGATAIKNLKDGSATGSLRSSASNNSLGNYAIALGYNAEASAPYSVALGQQTKATKDYSYAEGFNSIASGLISHAEGGNTEASGDYSHAEGNNTTASGNYSHAEGKGSSAFGEGSHAEGVSSFDLPDTITSSSTNDEIIESWKNTKFGMAKGESSHSEGKNTLALSSSSHAEGYQTTAYGSYSHAEGHQTTAYGSNSHAEGSSTTASGDYSHAEGYSTRAFGNYSHAEGYSTRAFGNYSHAEGYRTTASGNYSHAEGEDTTAFGLRSHAEGRGIYTNITLTGEASSTNYQVSTWNNNIKTGTVIIYQNSTAKIVSINEANNEIALNRTLSDVALSEVSAVLYYVGVASGDYSHMEGNQSIASGSTSHAEGEKTIASGAYSHAEGEKTIASSARSHAEGSSTVASGVCSHAEGANTIASGKFSHTEGYYTIASSNHQHTQGKYNVADSAQKYAHIVGNGESDTARSNAHTLDWNGNAWFAGNIYIGGTGQNDATAVKVAIVPFPTAADEGKILRVVNGAPTWVTLSSAEEASF